MLTFGDFLGLGEKMFAVPWNALKLDTANRRVVLNVNKDQLKNAPGFEKDNWPDMTDGTGAAAAPDTTKHWAPSPEIPAKAQAGKIRHGTDVGGLAATDCMARIPRAAADVRFPIIAIKHIN